jgi:hypothetical protein
MQGLVVLLNTLLFFDLSMLYPGPPKALDEDESEFLDKLALVSI